MKVWKIVALAVAVLAIGLVVFLATFDLGRYKGEIEQRATAAIGREVTVGGIRMGLSLAPTIVLTDLTVANAPWGSRPQMATVKQAEVTLQLLPLLAGRVDIGRIAVQGADVLLETNAQGQAAWESPAPAPERPATERPAAERPPALSIGALDGTDVKLAFVDGRTGERIDAAVQSIAARLSGPLAELNVSRLSLGKATLARHTKGETLQASLGKAQVEPRGPLADLAFETIELADLRVTGQGEHALEAAISALTLDRTGALELQGRYNRSDIKARGTVAWTGLKGGKRALPIKLAVEGMGLQGSVDLVVDAGRTPVAVKGSIVVPQIDLAALTGQSTSARPAPGTGARSPLFSREPLPWDSLRAVDADLDVSIGTLRPAKGPPLNKIGLPVRLTQGRLAVDGATMLLAGGRIEADFSADAAGRTVAFKGSAKGLTAEAIARAYGKDLITGGPLDGALEVRGRGASAQAIAASLDGSLLATMGDSRISNAALNIGGGLQTVLQVIATANPLARQEPYTAAKCAVLHFRIADGVARTRDGLAFITDKVQATGSGKIDFAHDDIDLIVRPTVSGALGAQIGKLVSTIRVSGTIDEPRIGVDAASTARAVAGLAAGVATGGAAGALLGLEAGSGGGRKLLGAIGRALGGDEPKQAAPADDICAAARSRRQE